MQTKQHWQECNYLQSYIAANNIALQLKEFAKEIGYDHRDINVYNKEQSRKHRIRADAVVVWKNGPIDWIDNINLKNHHNVCIEKDNNGFIYLFDLIYPHKDTDYDERF